MSHISGITATDYPRLTGVACARPDRCWAVGSIDGPRSLEQLVVSGVDGRWAVVRLPSPGVGSGLTAATCVGADSFTCVSATSCWAAGAREHRGVDTYSATGLLGHWDDHRWTTLALPGASESPELWAVTCRGAGDCVAVGDDVASDNAEQSGGPIVLRFDGRRWQKMPPPSGVARGATFDPSGRLWAVGRYVWSLPANRSVG